jgi:aldehyde dehydrogenase (NAD+)
MDILKVLKLRKHNAGAYSAKSGWSARKGGTVIRSYNPASQELIASVYASDAEDYAQLMWESTALQPNWAAVPAPKRGELIRLIGQKLRERKSALGSLVAMEMGKIKAEADGEVQEMIDMADLAVGQSRMLYGKTMHSERAGHRMYEQWHPLGVVGVITAFNFPVAVWAWNAFVAAVCGNTVVWKPSSKVPLCAIAVQHICNEAMEELGYPGVFSLFIPDATALAQALVEDPGIALVSFTGSSAVGQQIAQRVAGRFGRSLLECSGNNAVIVDATADLDLALRAVLFGAVGTAGQRCTTTRRLLIQRPVYDALVLRLRGAYAQVRIGNPLRKKVLMGPLIDARAVEDFEKAVAQARESGGQVLVGGKRRRGKGHFVEPTLIAVEQQFEVVREETFAPILYVMPFDTLQQAIALQNAVPQGLSSSLFTNDLKAAELFLSSAGSDCGIANVNIGTSGAEIGGAFGGEKHTGGGREAGSDAWQAYMRRQTNTINWSDSLPLAQGIEFAS